MYTVFTDFHHASLLQSFILLFEKRLGGKVYRPIGTEWHAQGFWKVYDHPNTVEQFLGVGGATPDGSEPLNEVLGVGARINGEIGKRYEYYRCHDIDSDTENKAITFDNFMQAPIDIVIASIPDHIEPFKRLCEIHPNKPKLIYQIGNSWGVESANVKNIMASAIPLSPVPEDVNFIVYHQEFDTQLFHAGDPQPDKTVKSFVNCFSVHDYMAHDWQLFQEVERLMPDWSFKCHGGQCRDNPVGPASVLADTMRASRFIWHTKAGGDGYGHVVHNIGAVGRPMLVKQQYYQGKLGEALMIDGETCIAIDNLNANEIVNKISYYNDDERYMEMCKKVYLNFLLRVNFNEEEIKLKAFLEHLK